MIYISTKLSIHTSDKLYCIIKLSNKIEIDRLYKLLYPINNNILKYNQEDTIIQKLFNYKIRKELYTISQIKEIYDIPNSNTTI